MPSTKKDEKSSAGIPINNSRKRTLVYHTESQAVESTSTAEETLPAKPKSKAKTKAKAKTTLSSSSAKKKGTNAKTSS